MCIPTTLLDLIHGLFHYMFPQISRILEYILFRCVFPIRSCVPILRNNMLPSVVTCLVVPYVCGRSECVFRIRIKEVGMKRKTLVSKQTLVHV